jgi:nucleotide-binding universal stress UspA family protein
MGVRDRHLLEAASAPAPVSVFGRIVVGVDGSAAGFAACRQAARLAEPDAEIVAVAVVHLSDAVHVAFRAAEMADLLQLEAEAALDEAKRILGERARLRFVNGFAVSALLREIEETDADLVALGTHGHHRLAEILLGDVSGELLHSAPCSVLIAREPTGGAWAPRSIAVGVDGSDPAAVALAAGRELAARVGADLRVIIARGGKGAEVEQTRSQAPQLEEIEGRPVPVLVEAARTADLLVVGSRGLHGFAALGSVSERVAHQAACSVLVVRPRDTAGKADRARG